MAERMEPRRGGESVFSDRGFTLIELLIVCTILSILAGMVVAHLLRAKSAANESSAIGTLRAINSAQMAFSSSCGNNFYAPTIARLVAGGFASADTSLPQKSGFNFALTAGTGAASAPDCTAQPTNTRYYVTAQPVSIATGRRAFATNPGGTIWEDNSGAGVAPPEPFITGASISPIQ